MSPDHASADPATDADRILDAALRLAELRGWDALQLHETARELGMPLTAIQLHFRQKDDLVEAWFDRADRAMLALADTPGWAALQPRERLFQAILAWLDALEPHRRLTRSMLGYRLHPEHVHLQAQGLVRISRTVQWIREVAMLPATGLRREVEEAALTGIYLATFARWLGDDSAGYAATRSFLQRRLDWAERAASGLGHWLPGSPRRA